MRKTTSSRKQSKRFLKAAKARKDFRKDAGGGGGEALGAEYKWVSTSQYDE